MTVLIERISALDPREFEHLTFDLLAVEGMRNLIWLAPGADGGRDVQGDVLHLDLSGTSTLEHWYVECKRYSVSVDWPTVYGKLAYAVNHNADYLLLCTTAFLSPKCKDEIQVHNGLRRRPLIRYWDRPNFEIRISAQPVLLAKYDLADVSKQTIPHVRALNEEIAKALYAAHGVAAFHDNVSRELDLASALAELVLHVTASPSISSLRSPVRTTDIPDWCEVGSKSPDFGGFSAPGLRAMLTGIRLVLRKDKLSIDATSDVVRIDMISPVDTIVAGRLLSTISIYADIDYKLATDCILLSPRTH